MATRPDDEADWAIDEAPGPDAPKRRAGFTLSVVLWMGDGQLGGHRLNAGPERVNPEGTNDTPNPSERDR